VSPENVEAYGSGFDSRAANGWLDGNHQTHYAALALESDSQVTSFDRDFDRIPGVTRVEP
jgi:predicted nucleic acid-binding protein